jgi:hypothetical protein
MAVSLSQRFGDSKQTFPHSAKGGLIQIADLESYRHASFGGVTLRPVFTMFGVEMTPSLYPDVQK